MESRCSGQIPEAGEQEEVRGRYTVQGARHKEQATCQGISSTERPGLMQKTYKIAVIPGDGTGPEVVAEGIKALKAVSKRCGVQFDFKEFPLGGEQYLKKGTLLPEEVIEELKGTDAIYLGAIGHPDV